ncbi:hypothetical protein, partial [Chengkuizengella marina]|uniref:hypothetical protein n=1 Tax=Chengkuizengella marina TaxID=2507566 RepID=UPI00137206B0
PKSTNLKSTNLSNSVGSGGSPVGNTGYLEPELNIPALGHQDPIPMSTYENRTTFRNIEPERFIPVNVTIEYSEFYKNDLWLSSLNQMFDEVDPDVDTFTGIFNPDTGELTNYFPIKPASNKLILYLNKHSYFAEGLTLDVEEWWASDPKYANTGYSRTGETHSWGIQRDTGVTDSIQNELAITHGTGREVALSLTTKYKILPVLEAEFQSGLKINFNDSTTESNVFSRTFYTAQHDKFDVTFDQYKGAPYKWAVYDLMTRTKVNYSRGIHFSELDDYFRNIKNVGLALDMSSNKVTIRNKQYATMAVPIYEETDAIQEPTNLTATQDFQNITITLNWDAVPAEKIDTSETPINDDTVAGYFVYKNGNLAATIHNPNRTSWVDYNVKPGVTNTYYLRSFSNYKHTTHLYNYKKISLQSNVVTQKVELDDAQFSQLVVGCSIPFTLTDNQM